MGLKRAAHAPIKVSLLASGGRAHPPDGERAGRG